MISHSEPDQCTCVPNVYDNVRITVKPPINSPPVARLLNDPVGDMQEEGGLLGGYTILL